MSECAIDKFSSRICELGTKSCVVEHLQNGGLDETNHSTTYGTGNDADTGVCFLEAPTASRV